MLPRQQLDCLFTLHNLHYLKNLRKYDSYNFYFIGINCILYLHCGLFAVFNIEYAKAKKENT